MLTQNSSSVTCVCLRSTERDYVKSLHQQMAEVRAREEEVSGGVC